MLFPLPLEPSLLEPLPWELLPLACLCASPSLEPSPDRGPLLLPFS